MNIETIKAQLLNLSTEEVRFILADARDRALASSYEPYVKQQTDIVFACSVELANRGE